jgi:transcription elongation factor GreA-like protein
MWAMNNNQKELNKKYKVIKKVKDNIPGFRDWDTTVIASFDALSDAESYLKTLQPESVFHRGYGAGSGSIDTSYYISEE